MRTVTKTKENLRIIVNDHPLYRSDYMQAMLSPLRNQRTERDECVQKRTERKQGLMHLSVV